MVGSERRVVTKGEEKSRKSSQSKVSQRGNTGRRTVRQTKTRSEEQGPGCWKNEEQDNHIPSSGELYTAPTREALTHQVEIKS